MRYLILILPLLLQCTGESSSLHRAIVNNSGWPIYTFKGCDLDGTCTATLSLSNSGPVAATKMTVTEAPRPPFSFAGGQYPGAGGTCTDSLPAAGHCTLTITFAPLNLGNAVSPLGIQYFDGAVVQPSRILLHGAGTPRGPLLTTFADREARRGAALTADWNNVRGGEPGNDTGMKYACAFDRSADGDVSAGKPCSALPGKVAFSASTGILTWTPGAAGTFELGVTGNSDGGSDTSFLVIEVR